MEYKKKEIGIPTYEQFEKYVLQTCGGWYSAEKLYDTMVSRKWKTSSGKPIKDLERSLIGLTSRDSWYYLTQEEQDKRKEIIRKKRERKVKKEINDIVSKKETPFSPYNEQLQDVRWKSFRCFIFEVRGFKCEMCGEVKKLQVHHINYIKGRMAWEYTCNDVIVLCEKCHRKAHGLRY